MLTDTLPAGTKVALHGDGPYTIIGSHVDAQGILVYALEEMRGYFWPHDQVTPWQGPPKVDIPQDASIPTEDTPEKLQMMAEVAKALNDEVIRQAPTHVGDTSLLDYDALAHAAMDAIVKRIMMDLAQFNAMAARIEEETAKNG
jgi:hypothetical protein